MVGDQHQVAGPDFGIERAGRIGQEQRRRAELGERFERRAHGGGIAVLVIVLAAGEDRRCACRPSADQQVAAVAADAARGNP